MACRLEILEVMGETLGIYGGRFADDVHAVRAIG